MTNQTLCLRATTLISTFFLLMFVPSKGNAQLTADFTYSPAKICTVPVQVNFKDKSTGNPVKWNWDFGDGNTSTAQNPLKVYLDSGSYNVQLIVEDASNNKDTTTQTVRVDFIKADFTSTPGPFVCASSAIVTVDLQSTSQASGILHYSWDINDNGTHTTLDDSPYVKTLNVDDPSHYLVATLTASNDAGCVATKKDTVGMGDAVNIVKAAGASIVVANEECTTNDGWTYYSYHDNAHPENSVLVLALKKNGNDIGTIGDGTFQVICAATVGAGGNIAVLLTNPIITNPSGYWAMNRYWEVQATHQPTSPIGVRYYFNSQDLTDVNSSYITHDLKYTDLIFYKTTDGNPDPTSNLDGATSIESMLNGSSPDLTSWVYTNIYGKKHISEFEVSNLTGGGSGGSTGNHQVLPLQLISFTGVNAGNNTAQLNWVTTNEVNVAKIEIERSLDSRYFAVVGSVTPKGAKVGNNDYSFTYPETKTNGSAYYRLKITDNDGKISHSQIIKIDFQSNVISIYPVPVKNNLVNVKLDKYYPGISVKIFSSTGNTVLQSQKQPDANNLIQINTSSLSKGFYKMVIFSNGLKIGDGNIIIE